MGQKNCPVEQTVNIIGGKWTLLILRDLFGGTRRFGEMRTSLTGISPRHSLKNYEPWNRMELLRERFTLKYRPAWSIH